ncbi:hypothetical protein P3X46_030208 [Hevea brasiliensis]|uniref:Trehalase n=1 Tax=Hevea brasiliensis TaxID=3981 RepID=A0ABQ9KW47_HEVBR|nr:trehalase [Hevea brasiliensis]KAJ9148117.1 hypothetical protein P3X46_030208 [Hevea brasiliensis]
MASSHQSQNLDLIFICKETTPLVAFLERVQETALSTFVDRHFDPKFYVDLSLKYSLSTTEKAFDGLPRTENGAVSVKDLEEFLTTYFQDAGKDAVHYDPPDFLPEPVGFLPKVENPEVRAWALDVHSLWKNLSRKVSDEVRKQPELHTFLPLPAPMIVPGSRFREVYYWDSYWVIRGLLASKMYETAKSIVTNLISLVNVYGYALNGARAYYTNRSQPPLLSAMVYEIYNRTGDMELAKKALPVLLKEHQFWNSEIHKITIQDAQGRNHTLSRYYAMWNKPRPESSVLDKKYASKLLKVSEKQQFYRELASAAESGWDFSTRWMRNSSEFTTLATTSVLPVDLNVFILKMELDIAFLANKTGEESIAASFLEASQARKRAINSVFWNEKMGQWLDYWLTTGTTCQESQTWNACNQNQNVFASNFSPLWIDMFNSDANLVKSIMRSLESSGLLCAAGIATSLTNSGEQWDFPNGWAPFQHIIVEGLARSGSQEARSLAEDIAVRWIRTNYVTYKKTGAMHEKYNVEKCGEFGRGGKYVPQTGFGWSNGVALAFLEEFGWPRDHRIDC